MADEIDLDQRTRDEEPRRTDGRPCRRNLEILLPDLVEGVEVRKVDHEHLSLEHLVERASGSLERFLEIAEDVVGLLFDVRTVKREGRVLPRFGGNAGLIVARDVVF